MVQVQVQVYIVQVVNDESKINDVYIFSNRKDALVKVVKVTYRECDSEYEELLEKLLLVESESDLDDIESDIDWNCAFMQCESITV